MTPAILAGELASADLGNAMSGRAYYALAESILEHAQPGGAW